MSQRDVIPFGPRELPDASPACDRFDASLADYLDGSLEPGRRGEAERHRADCPRCAALVADLDAVSRAAASLPTLRPERDLWAGIASRIDEGGQVLPLRVERASRRDAGRATVTFSRRWLGAAAAALVAVTSALTYAFVRLDPPAGGDAAGRPAAGGAATLAAAPAPNGAAPAPAPAPGLAPNASRERPAAPRPNDIRVAPGGAPPAAPAAPAARLASDPGVSGAAAYDREIAALRAVVRARRASLDTATVRVLEENLGVIDRAIEQSRAALARDPGSQFLDGQLLRALGSKVELLRTAALLPARGA